MAATWIYDGMGRVNVVWTVPLAWPPGDNARIYADDPNSTFTYFGAVNPGDVVNFTIQTIGGLGPGDPFNALIDDFDASINYETQPFAFGTPVNFNADLVMVLIDTYDFPNFYGPPASTYDVTNCALDGSVTLRFNRVSEATVRVPMDCAAGIGDVGSFMRVYFGGFLTFHGRILNLEVSADENFGYVVLNASDPFELWAHRPVRDDDGDFTNPLLFETYIYGPQIIQAMFANTEDTTTGGGGSPFAPGYGADSEGPMRQVLNSIEGGTVPLTAHLADWPQTMAQLAALIISTNTTDLVNTPIEIDAQGNVGQLDIYAGAYGRDLSADVVFEYGMGARNVRALRWNKDMSDMCNKLWYYLGPRVKTAADPGGNQHWKANITGTDGGLQYPPGGEATAPWGIGAVLTNAIGLMDSFSRSKYDVRMDIKIFDALQDEAFVARELFRRQWQEEQYLRAQPRTLVHVTPIRGGAAIGTFNPGDIVGVNITPDVLGGLTSVAQRVYAFTISWDVQSVPAISELEVSSDQSGFDA